MKRLLTLALVVCAGAFAQNAALMPLPRISFLDGNGAPVAGGYLRTCTAGTACSALHPWSTPSNPLASYTDSSAAVPAANPIVLDSAGSASVWLGAGTYKVVLTDADGAAVWTQDNVSSLAMTAKTLATGAPLRARITTTAAVSDAVSLLGVTASSYCVVTASNGTAAALTGVYVSKGTNSITLAHSATAGATFDVICTAN